MSDRWAEIIGSAVGRMASWEAQWSGFEQDASIQLSDVRTTQILDELAERLRDNYPFFHPLYAGQMLKPPHAIAAAAYAMAQRINPNAHALDGGPATSYLEIEVVHQLAAMCGYSPETTLGHLTSSGTIANLEALWVARETHPHKGIACSDAAHYTHARMSQLLRMPCVSIRSDSAGRIDLDALESTLRGGDIGTVVATAGTTSIGAVDDVASIRELTDRYGVRLHVDAAYGGFFRILASGSGTPLRQETATAFRAIDQADSIVIDPHKHGLQPYGCGSVLFRDASVGRFYKHDSPYTYFTSDELHLGEISLECSRSGAAAAALWATLQAFPLTRDGMGSILEKTRGAAVEWARLLSSVSEARLLVEPELDIVGFYLVPAAEPTSTRALSAHTQAVFERLMRDTASPLYLATLRVERSLIPNHALDWDTESLLAFRSVLMKPEHYGMVGQLHHQVMETSRASQLPS